MQSDLPQDMRDLLIRLDQRVDDGFRAVSEKLDSITRRTDNHETRIAELEKAEVARAQRVVVFDRVVADVDALKSENDRESGQKKGWLEMGGAVKAIIIVLMATIAVFGWKLSVTPDEQSKTVITHSVTQ